MPDFIIGQWEHNWYSAIHSQQFCMHWRRGHFLDIE